MRNYGSDYVKFDLTILRLKNNHIQGMWYISIKNQSKIQVGTEIDQFEFIRYKNYTFKIEGRNKSFCKI